MHDIISIEKICLNQDGDITVEAVLENMGPLSSLQTLYDAPEYAPCLCETTIGKEHVPPWMKLEDKEELLEDIINRYNLLAGQYWYPIQIDDSDKYWDDYDGPM